jgi:sugar phosphate isomerase/epimerase
MAHTSRRSFLSAAGFAASALATRAASRQAYGVQLYTVRDILPKAPLETFKTIEAMGYREVEAVDMGFDALWPALQQTGLKPVGIHFDTPLFLTKMDLLPAAMDKAKSRGFQIVLCPWINPPDRTPDKMKALAANLNKAGELAKQRGLGLCYHNHAFEFAPSPDGTVLDSLMKETDPKLVHLEFDIMWSTVAGVDPVSVLRKYSGRIATIHVKNVKSGVEKRFNEMVPKDKFAEVPNGIIDVPKVLKAAKTAGVKHYFVEQDFTPGDPLASLKQSIDYLKTLDV